MAQPMSHEAVRFIQIATDKDNLYALDREGRVFVWVVAGWRRLESDHRRFPEPRGVS